MKKTLKKCDAIREVVSKHAGLTNKQVRDEVKQRFGLTVFDSQVIAVAGTCHERLANGFPPHLIQQAKAFLIAVGGEYRQAKRVLEMVRL